jgi:dTDP-4-amino-4,6-dideoxygalactose transaminase
MMRKRRENYSSLIASLRGCATLRVLIDELPDDFVPYMAPVLLEEPARQFAALKSKGVPMWRWEHSQMGVCPVTDRLAQALIQIPCHQSLRAAELGWIGDALRSVGGSR